MNTWAVGIVSIALFAPLAGALPPSDPPRDDSSQFKQWAAIKSPLPGEPETIGNYDAGCLAGAVKIDADGKGFAMMRLKRHRYYAHAEMNDYLHALGERLQNKKMPLLLIGDVSPPRGGPMLSGHNSHQIGLDADLWLRMGKTRPTTKQRESWGAPSFVLGRKKLKKTWGPTQVNLITAAVGFDVVNRIFVSPPIKKYFCQHFAEADWLYKLRPWWGHDEHIHVRLNCPQGSTTCQPQAALKPSENGCGADLDWWFSKEADDKWAEMASDTSARHFPELPPACGKMLARNTNL